MSGSITSKHIISTTARSSVDASAIDTFAAIVEYYSNQGGFQRIASYYGVSSSGLNYSSAPNRTGNGAFAVFRAMSSSVIYDIAVAYTSSVGSFDGPWYSSTNHGVGIVACWHSSSAAWNGTTNNNGTDSFITPWKSGSKTTLTINNSGATYGSGSNGIMQVMQGVGGNTNILITGDYDTTFILTMNGRNPVVTNGAQGTNTLVGIGVYDAITASYSAPIFQWNLAKGGGLAGVNESPIGAGNSLDAGLVANNSYKTLAYGSEFSIGANQRGPTTHLYSNIRTANIIYEFNLNIWTQDWNLGYRPLGKIPLIHLVSNHPHGQIRFYNNNSSVVVGSAVDTTISFSLPWNSSSLPKEATGTY